MAQVPSDRRTLGAEMHTLNKLLLPFCFAVILGVPSTAAQSSGPTPGELAQVDLLFSTELAKQNYGGVTAGIIYQNRLVWTKSFGLADIENNVRASAETVYPVGSITKLFTALMLQQLVARRLVHLGGPVAMYVPEVAQIQNPFPHAAPMTLYQLATHTAGLQDVDMPFPPRAVPGTPWEQVLISWLPQLKVDFEPGTQVQYSNIGYAILGLALERAAGQPYVAYIQNQILIPLGMTHTGFELTPEMAAHVAKGYMIMPNGTLSPPLDPAKRPILPAFFWPAGGLFTTVGDLAKFVAFELGQGLDAVLSTQQINANFAEVGAATGDFCLGYGVGFTVNRIGNSLDVGHDGAIATGGGYTASAQMRRQAQAGMIFLRNFVNTSSAAPFGVDFEILVLDVATGVRPSPRGDQSPGCP
jgi:CubicO group peptidase (beta-lactamase class C family)